MQTIGLENYFLGQESVNNVSSLIVTCYNCVQPVIAWECESHTFFLVHLIPITPCFFFYSLFFEVFVAAWSALPNVVLDHHLLERQIDATHSNDDDSQWWFWSLDRHGSDGEHRFSIAYEAVFHMDLFQRPWDTEWVMLFLVSLVWCSRLWSQNHALSVTLYFSFFA